ncbi:MAG: glycoside hydrolase family 13 protein [Clostridia bacterium]|nr:glycoside hydrolase family 13 protein [Clostridia bacterium]
MSSVLFDIRASGTPAGCFAFRKDARPQFILSVLGGSCTRAWLYIGNDERVLIQTEAALTAAVEGFSARCEVEVGALTGHTGLFFCHFEYLDGEGKRRYTAFDENGGCYISDKYENESQFLVYSAVYKAPQRFFGGAVYQIFPDRFAPGGKSERKPEAVYNGDWEHGIPEYPARAGDAFKNNTHFGGTLWGAAEKIPYLKSLGITCVYFNPLCEAYSNHKYDTADYLKVDGTFGGDEALKAFVKAAHENGISVVLDGVFNHVGDDSVYFDRLGRYGNGACDSKDSPYYGWFDFTEYPNEYACWWGIKNLPRTVRCREYRDFITQKVIPHYMEMGVDGWRLDVVDELESDFVSEIAAAIKRCREDAIIIGEVWEDASNKSAYGERKKYFCGFQLDSVTNYPLRNAVIDFAVTGETGLLVRTVRTLARHYPFANQQLLLNFLGSHDTERITTVLGGEGGDCSPNPVLAKKRLAPEARARAKKLLVCAYTLLAAMPGLPCIYYGDEIAMEGAHDPFNRRPFPPSGFADPFSQNFAAVNNSRAEYREYFALPVVSARGLCAGCAEIIRGDGIKKLIAVSNSGAKETRYDPGFKTLDIITGAAYEGELTVPAETTLLLINGE